MNEPIVSRIFSIDGQDVNCSFYKPEADRNDFMCRYTIGFPDRLRSSYAYGVDPMQALLLAVQRAHVDLLASDYYREGRLIWLESSDLGLPLPSGISISDFDQPK